ncbi:response regulator transcription factor [Synechococcus sp. BIOS-U3-1]|uniref:response regulator transcription factor n=1 Tax=Synechococcus sp. BIOS-U3-1 TaxID=1400865 RepID=UPI001646D3CC|nr:response regulator transcription factor [Synechococcus sp. BIOS-U3-1]
MNCLVIDDQTIFLDLLASLLKSFPEIESVAKADCIKSAEALSERETFDIAIIDLILPDGDGCDLATTLMQKHPNIQLIILSGSAQEFICPIHLQNSICGIIDKADAFESLRNCLNSIIKPAHQSLTQRQKEIYALMGEGKSNKEIAQQLGSASLEALIQVQRNSCELYISGRRNVEAVS